MQGSNSNSRSDSNPLSPSTTTNRHHRHSTGCLEDHHMYRDDCRRRRRRHTNNNNNSSSSNNMMITQTMMDNSSTSAYGGDLSLSDLPPIKPSRSRSGLIRKKKCGVSSSSSSMMDCSTSSANNNNNNNNMDHDLSLSCRTATTCVEDSSSSLMMSSMGFSYSSSSRRSQSEPFNNSNSSSSFGMMSDGSTMSMSSSTRRRQRRELRNLKGIQRRRSDPVTKRWREQCSKLYKEHVLLEEEQPDTTSAVSFSCPELPTRTCPPPLMVSTQLPEEASSAEMIAAARQIQSIVRRYLLPLRSSRTATTARKDHKNRLGRHEKFLQECSGGFVEREDT